MLKSYASAAGTYIVQYRGYVIEVSRELTGWCAGVHPRNADLPILRHNAIQACDQDEAIVEAMDRVDGLLRH